MSLRIEGLAVTYGKHRVLDGIDVSVPAGTVTAVVGPNGAGKSTLLRAVLGLLPCEGRITAGGMDLRGRRSDRQGSRIGYLPQDNAASSALTALDVVLLGRIEKLGWHLSRDELEMALATLERLGLGRLASVPIGELSGGQRQLVFLAQALARAPAVLLLDEPTSALDLKHQLIVLSTLRSIAQTDGIAILLVMHELNLAARFADQIAVLHGGRIHSAGPPAAVLTLDMFAEVFEVEGELLERAQGPDLFVPTQARSV